MNSDTRTPGSFHPWKYVQEWARQIAVSKDSGLGHLRVRFSDATTFSVGSLGDRWSLTVYARSKVPRVYEAESIYECIAMAILGGDTLRPLPDRQAVHTPPPEATRELEELRVELAQVRLMLKQAEAEREKEAAQRDLAVAERLRFRFDLKNAIAEREALGAKLEELRAVLTRVMKECDELRAKLERVRGLPRFVAGHGRAMWADDDGDYVSWADIAAIIGKDGAG